MKRFDDELYNACQRLFLKTDAVIQYPRQKLVNIEVVLKG